MALTADEIFGASPTGPARVSTPEWGGENGEGHVYVRVLGASEMGDVQKLLDVPAGSSKEMTVMARLCVFCISDKDGKRLFADDAIDRLLGGPMAPMIRCANKAITVNGLDTTVQELAGN